MLVFVVSLPSAVCQKNFDRLKVGGTSTTNFFARFYMEQAGWEKLLEKIGKTDIIILYQLECFL